MLSLPSFFRSRGDLRGRYAHIDPHFSSEEGYHLDILPRSRWTLGAILVRFHKASVARFGRRRGPVFLYSVYLLSVYLLCSYIVSSVSARLWPPPIVSLSVFRLNDVRTIWEWEIRSGHYPSNRPIPAEVGFTAAPSNPAIPSDGSSDPSSHPDDGVVRHTVGTGVQRIYKSAPNRTTLGGYPPRPSAGSVADLDKILQHCDFATNKYVRDCLEILRIDAGLGHSARLRRGDVHDLKYVYVLDDEADARTHHDAEAPLANATIHDQDRDITLPPVAVYNPVSNRAAMCTKDEPRVFHMFWTGPFTDKPYMAILAFLFTQNLGLHLDTPSSEPSYCRPQLWFWVSVGSSENAMPSPTAEQDMYEELRTNGWTAPFLHPRFRDVIRFRLWNTTEQLDSLSELKDDWRNLGRTLGHSDGSTVGADPEKLKELGPETPKTYDKVPVVLSDLVRLVLCHRFGGIYLDVDMLLLRDWEELWNWPGAFAYRWSWKDAYNTAVFRLRRGSALGTFLIRTALANDLDFHPLAITRYLKDAHMEELLFRVPDALFDPTWLVADYEPMIPYRRRYYQQDRPPQPFFSQFEHFFNTPQQTSGMPIVAGFDGFFRGAFSYHYHNQWWTPFDRARPWSDLGPRFAEAERMGWNAVANDNITDKLEAGIVMGDEQDLSWATVLKRTFEAYIRGEQPNMYGEWIKW